MPLMRSDASPGRIRPCGDVVYPESLHQILTRLRLLDRQREKDRERKLQQVLIYVRWRASAAPPTRK